jgi:hypothetical protein
MGANCGPQIGVQTSTARLSPPEVEEDLGETRHEQFRSHHRNILAADFSLTAASIACARIVKTLCNSLTALAAFAIASNLIASSFAGEFTVHQGNRYRAILALGSVERLADKAAIAQKFRALGFVSVCVSGSGARRRVEGVWPGKKTNANLPPQIVAVAKL